jgi:hypothetical protein
MFVRVDERAADMRLVVLIACGMDPRRPVGATFVEPYTEPGANW